MTTKAVSALGRGLLATAFLSAVAACAAEGRSPFGGTWTAIAAAGVEIGSNPNSPRLQFTVGGRVNIVTSCGEFSAPVTVAGPTIAIGELTIRTTGPCTTQDHEIQSAILAILREATEFTGGSPGDRLHIRGAAGELVLAQPRPGLSYETE